MSLLRQAAVVRFMGWIFFLAWQLRCFYIANRRLLLHLKGISMTLHLLLLLPEEARVRPRFVAGDNISEKKGIFCQYSFSSSFTKVALENVDLPRFGGHI